MTDDEFNTSMRKFLKQVGVTSQQAIETAIRDARVQGKLPAGPLTAKMVLTIDAINLSHQVDGEIKSGGAA